MLNFSKSRCRFGSGFFLGNFAVLPRDVFNLCHTTSLTFFQSRLAQHPNAAAVRAPVGREADGAIRYVERSFAAVGCGGVATAHTI